MHCGADVGDDSRPVRTCYMCNEPETSREHVPAACFFPETKDLPPGIDLRRNLFTVPSCDTHNSHKSNDDQYLWQIVAAYSSDRERAFHVIVNDQVMCVLTGVLVGRRSAWQVIVSMSIRCGISGRSSTLVHS